MNPWRSSDQRPLPAETATVPSFRLESGELVLWQGRPDARALGRHLFKLRWLAAYFGLLMAWKIILIVGIRGIHPQEVADAAILLVQTFFLLGLLTLFARALARSTTYTVTNLRIVIQHGVALARTVDIPLNAMRQVAVRIHRDGSGDVALGVNPGSGAHYAKLWPHVRGWPSSIGGPMLRGLPDAAILGTMLARQLEMQPTAGTALLPAVASVGTRSSVDAAAA